MYQEENFLERASSWFFKWFRLISKTLGIIALSVVDIAISGVVLYNIFGQTEEIQGGWIAIGLSLALTAISIQLWSEIRNTKSSTSILIIAVIIVLQCIDLYVDLSLMEIVYGTGNPWEFLTAKALSDVYRPPLWWALVILLAILTIVNEPLVFSMISNGKNRQIRPNISNMNDPYNQREQFYREQTPNKQTNRKQQTVQKTNKRFPYSINKDKLDNNSMEYRIILTFKEHYHKTGKECPNKILTEQTGASKGYVSTVISKLKNHGYA